MRHLDLDYQPRGLTPLGLAVMGLGLLFLVGAVSAYQEEAEAAQHWQEELARVQQPARRAPSRGADAPEVQQAAKAATAVAEDIHRPWEALFRVLEKAKTDEVALLALNPDAAKGIVRITGEAKKREAILAFIERLGEGNVLTNVVLVEDQIQSQDQEQPYRFLITADWRGAA